MRSERIEWVIGPGGIARAKVPAAAAMARPVRCNGCGHVHDAEKVTVTARYSDCSMWKCPRCGVLRDDRPGGIGGITRLDKDGIPHAGL